MATNLVQIENDQEIKQRLEAERMRLRKIAGLDRPDHFHRPVERAFTAEERNRVTILFGGFTWKHEDLIRAVFQGCGYRCEKLPVPDVPAFQLGKEYGNNGQCNPTYFTVGNLVQYLQFLEKEGVPRKDILDNYVFFTAGSCGPCRFGMYEAEYRFALKNAGFDGFRVLLFKDSDGIKAASGEPGLKFTIDFGLGMLNAMHLGDVINDLIYQIRPFEVNKGETDRVFREMVDGLCDDLRNRDSFEIEQRSPNWAKPKFKEPMARDHDPGPSSRREPPGQRPRCAGMGRRGRRVDGRYAGAGMGAVPAAPGAPRARPRRQRRGLGRPDRDLPSADRRDPRRPELAPWRLLRRTHRPGHRHGYRPPDRAPDLPLRHGDKHPIRPDRHDRR